MIERIRGRVEESGPDWIILSLGVISLRILTTSSTVGALADKTEDVTVHTHLYTREDLIALYGFATSDERTLFERLISVTGIGPRAAQLMLSALSPSALYEAIEHEQVDILVRVPGVGRKTAQRVILELKGKLANLGPSAGGPVSSGDGELVGVLVGLGYSPAEASAALRNNPPKEGLSDEDRLRAALRHFTS